MKILVKFFAIFRDKTGKSQIECNFNRKMTTRDLKIYLEEQFPSIREYMPNVVTAINFEFASDNDEIPDGAEIAIFPPVSGGSEKLTIIRVTEKSISVDEVIGLLSSPSTGAICAFTGIVRGITSFGNFHETSYLEYEAYREMAELKLKQITNEIWKRWPKIESIAIIQRIGKIEPGNPTVIIACAGAHRDSGIFEGAQFGINRVKEIAPIWKKEISPTGEVWVEGKYHPMKGD